MQLSVSFGERFVDHFGYKFDVHLLDGSPALKAGVEAATTEDEMKVAVGKWAASKGLRVTFETCHNPKFNYVQLRMPK